MGQAKAAVKDEKNVAEDGKVADADFFLQQDKLNTIRGIEKEEDVVGYPVGFVLQAWLRDYLMPTYYGPKYFETIKKYPQIQHLFWQLIVFICRADGKLGELEKKFILKNLKEWKITDEKIINKYLNSNTDCSKEYLEIVIKQGDDMFGKNSNKSQQFVNNSKISILYWVIMASSQDGLVRDEINQVYQLAKSFGIDKQVVKDIAQILRYEQAIAKKIL